VSYWCTGILLSRRRAHSHTGRRSSSSVTIDLEHMYFNGGVHTDARLCVTGPLLSRPDIVVVGYMLCSNVSAGLLETPVSSEDIPVIRNTKFMYQSCVNLSMISSIFCLLSIMFQDTLHIPVVQLYVTVY